jgi:hypothetical protein
VTNAELEPSAEIIVLRDPRLGHVDQALECAAGEVHLSCVRPVQGSGMGVGTDADHDLASRHARDHVITQEEAEPPEGPLLGYGGQVVEHLSYALRGPFVARHRSHSRPESESDRRGRRSRSLEP